MKKTPSSKQLWVRQGHFKNKRSYYAMHQAEQHMGLFWGQTLWSLSRTKAEFLTKQKRSTLNLAALLMLLSKYIFSRGVAEVLLTVFAPIRPNLKPMAKIPWICRGPGLGSLLLSLPILGCPFSSLHERAYSC